MENMPCNIHYLIFCGVLLRITKSKPGNFGANTITNSKVLPETFLLKIFDIETLKNKLYCEVCNLDKSYF